MMAVDGGEVEAAEAADQCLYCEEMVPRSQRASHKSSRHLRLDFECRFCVKQYYYLRDLVAHLKVRTA